MRNLANKIFASKNNILYSQTQKNFGISDNKEDIQIHQNLQVYF